VVLKTREIFNKTVSSVSSSFQQAPALIRDVYASHLQIAEQKLFLHLSVFYQLENAKSEKKKKRPGCIRMHMDALAAHSLALAIP
jgi:hypothetical protein